MKLTALERIVDYQCRNRQVGHTTFMLDGILGTKKPIIIVGDANQRQWMTAQLKKFFNISKADANELIFTVAQVNRGCLDDISGRPLAIDNVGLFAIAMDCAKNQDELFKEFMKSEMNGRTAK